MQLNFYILKKWPSFPVISFIFLHHQLLFDTKWQFVNRKFIKKITMIINNEGNKIIETVKIMIQSVMTQMNNFIYQAWATEPLLRQYRKEP